MDRRRRQLQRRSQRRRQRQRVFTVVDNYTFCFVSVFVIFDALFLFLLLLCAYFYELIILMNARLAEPATMCHNKKVESIFVAASLAPS